MHHSKQKHLVVTKTFITKEHRNEIIQTDRQTHIQTYRHTYIHTYIHT